MSNTISLKRRKQVLKSLKKNIVNNKESILDALTKDYSKPHFESLSSEYNLVLNELDYTLKNIDNLCRDERVSPSLMNFPSRSKIKRLPYGKVLLIGPWNYPFQLIFSPLIGAIAAGNTVVVKPSELSEHTSNICEKIIKISFEKEEVSCRLGGVEVAQELLSQRWDYIFFTGSVKVGKIVAKAAAENLCPVTLELGGKNPCIVTKDADLKLSAKRITWGKFTNNGQTCIAPDYLLVDNSIKEKLIQYIQESIEEFYGTNPQENKDYSRIINRSNFERLRDMTKGSTVLYGGTFNETDRYISPTLIEGPELDHALMLEEIFGPILPIYGYDDISEVREFIGNFEAPLAFYLFTSKTRWAEKYMSSFSYGGGSINDVMAHFINSKLPFGGKGHSGLGAYHGKHSIRTFQHESALTTKSTWLDIPLRYPPYSNKEKLMSSVMRLFG